MRTIVNVTNVSLDGVMDRMEDWHFDYTDQSMDDFIWETLEPCDTLLIGRESYESFAATWPGQSGRVADRLNSMRKQVVSRTLTDPAWENSAVLEGDLETALAALKNEDGGGVMSYGFGPVAHALLDAGLLDRMHVLVNPVLAGKGDVADMLIREGAQARLHLDAVRGLSSGVAVLTYQSTSTQEGR